MAERWSFTNPECLGFNLLLIWERFLSGKELPGCRLPALPWPLPPTLSLLLLPGGFSARLPEEAGRAGPWPSGRRQAGAACPYQPRPTCPAPLGSSPGVCLGSGPRKGCKRQQTRGCQDGDGNR